MELERKVTNLCLFVTISVIFLDLVHTYTEDTIRRETACAGRCSYKYSLQCSVGQKIGIRELEYGAKKVSSTCPDQPEPCQVNYNDCCRYYGGDCLMSFSDAKAYQVYQNCSAMPQCGRFAAEAIDMQSRCMFRKTSNYVAASYKCVDDSSFLDVCSNDIRHGKTVNLIYRGNTQNKTTSSQTELCNCLVSTSNCKSLSRLRFRTADIRLQQQDSMRSCHIHSKFFITDTMGHRNFSCKTNHMYRGYSDLYYSQPNNPYARISLYNRPGQFPSFFWLEISATLEDVDVVVSCGKANDNRTLCGDAELLPSTKIHGGRNPRPTPDPRYMVPPSTNDMFADHGKDKPRAPQNVGNADDSSGENSDLMMIIIGVVSGVVVLSAIIVIICCIHRRKKSKEREKKLKTLPPIMYPPTPPYNSEESGGEYGNYYESMGTLELNGRHMVLGDNKGSFSPAPGSAPPISPFSKPPLSASPFSKPPEPPKVKPKPVEPPRIDDNPYNAPWDSKPLPTPNRVKKDDLAYAASDEIQVLIKRMESDRRKLNEGSSTSDDKPKSKAGYIHINDYKFEDTPVLDRQKDELNDEEHSSDDEHDGDENDPINQLSNQPLENSVTDKSEDTGYRSVGSAVETPDQILVSEDDYLVPGSARSTLSSQRSVSKSDSNHNTDRLDNGQADVQRDVVADNDDVFNSSESKTTF